VFQEAEEIAAGVENRFILQKISEKKIDEDSGASVLATARSLVFAVRGGSESNCYPVRFLDPV
jgi:hypothetical protein